MRLIHPRIVYDGTPLEFSLPQMLWTPRTATLGGSDRVASGTGESYLVRRDEILIVRFRFTSAEYAGVHAFFVWAMDGMPAFAFRLDRTNVASERTADLDSPRMGDDWTPERDPTFRGHWTTEAHIRATAGGPWNIAGTP